MTPGVWGWYELFWRVADNLTNKDGYFYGIFCFLPCSRDVLGLSCPLLLVFMYPSICLQLLFSHRFFAPLPVELVWCMIPCDSRLTIVRAHRQKFEAERCEVPDEYISRVNRQRNINKNVWNRKGPRTDDRMRYY